MSEQSAADVKDAEEEVVDEKGTEEEKTDGGKEWAARKLAEMKSATEEMDKLKLSEADVWGDIPEEVKLKTIGNEEITVTLRFPAKKELQVITLIRREAKKAGSEVQKLVAEEMNFVDQIDMILAYVPNLAIQVAALLMEREATWIEENLSFSSIAKVVKPFFMGWLDIFDLKTLEQFLPLDLG